MCWMCWVHLPQSQKGKQSPPGWWLEIPNWTLRNATGWVGEVDPTYVNEEDWKGILFWHCFWEIWRSPPGMNKKENQSICCCRYWRISSINSILGESIRPFPPTNGWSSGYEEGSQRRSIDPPTNPALAKWQASSLHFHASSRWVI